MSTPTQTPALTAPFLAGKALDTPAGPAVVSRVVAGRGWCRLTLSDGTKLSKRPGTGWVWSTRSGLFGEPVRLAPGGFRRMNLIERLMADVAATFLIQPN